MQIVVLVDFYVKCIAGNLPTFVTTPKGIFHFYIWNIHDMHAVKAFFFSCFQPNCFMILLPRTRKHSKSLSFILLCPPQLEFGLTSFSQISAFLLSSSSSSCLWMIITLIMACRHIPTMTKSHHGGYMSVMIKVGMCQ